MARKTDWNRVTRRRLRRPRTVFALAGALVLAVVLGGIAAIYAVPWTIDRSLAAYANAAPGRVATRESIQFDPLTLSVEIRGLELGDAASGSRFSAERVAIDLAARSFFELRAVASAVTVDEPRLTLASVSGLPALGRKTRPALLEAAHIDRLEVADGSFLAAAGGEQPIELTGIALTLRDIDGRSGNEAPFRLAATTPAGAGMEAEGSLSPALDAASGSLRLEAFGLEAIASRLGGTLGSLDMRGQLDLNARLDAARLLTDPVVELTDATIEVTALSLTPAPGIGVGTASAVASGATVVFRPAAATIGIALALEAGELTVIDLGAAPRRRFDVVGASLEATADTGGAETVLALAGTIEDAGAASLVVRTPRESAREVSISAAGIPAATLSPYAVDALGRGLADGTYDLDLDYTVEGPLVVGRLELTAGGLSFATPAVPASGGEFAADDSLLELAAALLENRDGRLAVAAAFAAAAGTMRESVATALNARLDAIAARPLAALAPLFGAAGGVGSIPFAAGETEIGDAAAASIARLATALEARPRLGLRVHGATADADRDALAKQQIELHVQLATAGPALEARPQPVNFDSVRARDVLNEFAGERLPAPRLGALAARFGCESTQSTSCVRDYYESVFDALVENEAIAPTTLNRLGRFRAQSVVDALTALGIDAARLEVAPARTVDAVSARVGLPLEFRALAGTP